VNFNNLAGPKKMRNSFAGPFIIKALHGKNAVEVILTEEFSRKHPTFPVSLIKHYNASDQEKFPDRNIVAQTPIHYQKICFNCHQVTCRLIPS
jgi:hypothetical protein